MLAKAATVEVDEVILDLEDAVTAARKDEARAQVVRVLREGSFAARTVAVRVNQPRSAWCHCDLEALAGAPALDAVVVPKVEDLGDLAFVDRLLDGVEAQAGRERPLRVEALIETALGLQRVGRLAAGSERLDTLILGYADLAASLGRAGAQAGDPLFWLPAQHAVLTAARAHNLQAIDGPHLDPGDHGALRARAVHIRDLGFDGKWAIHPDQVPTLNEVFTPSPEEVARARAVLASLADAAERGEGAVSLDGAMVDEAMRAPAMAVLARAGAR
jgi:citrate lyase subunit beta/citryl-CoA lyase